MEKGLLVYMYIYMIMYIQYTYILPWNQSCTEANQSKLSKEVLPKDSPALKFKNATCHGVQFLAKYRNEISSQCFKMHHSTLSKIKTFVSNTKASKNNVYSQKNLIPINSVLH